MACFRATIECLMKTSRFCLLNITLRIKKFSCHKTIFYFKMNLESQGRCKSRSQRVYTLHPAYPIVRLHKHTTIDKTHKIRIGTILLTITQIFKIILTFFFANSILYFRIQGPTLHSGVLFPQISISDSFSIFPCYDTLNSAAQKAFSQFQFV